MACATSFYGRRGSFAVPVRKAFRPAEPAPRRISELPNSLDYKDVDALCSWQRVVPDRGP